ncbi:MAG TPA: family 16 glycoside hydrolase [Chitinophagaceae bacterium]|nr:family 16 glycoside hydrolase [Chitinophagaceae bacterium]
MMKKILPLLVVIFISCASHQRTSTTNNWVKLFNGKDINDWIVKIYHHNTGENFGNTFRVEDGIIKVRYDQYGDFNDQFGHLYYKTPFSNYHLKLDYRFAGTLQKGAPSYTILNSGVMFHSQDPRGMLKEQNWPISIEMQFLAGLGDGKPRPTGNMCSPGTDIIFQGKLYPGHCLNSSSKTYDKDEWVSAELIVLGDSLIKHIINGDTVLQYSKPTMGGGVVAGYDAKLWQPGKALSSGYIALQSEGQPIDFRNIEIKQLQQ